MNNFISSLENIGFGEAMLFMVIGMIIILIVLSLLVGLLYIIRFAVAAIEKPKKENSPAPKPTMNIAATEIDADEEVVAAITAAITCILQSESKDETVVAPFKIKKIKHTH